VDDNPEPFKELRRVLDLGLAYNYGDRSFKLLESKKIPEAREAAEQAVHYSPDNSDSHMGLAFLDYLAGEKKASLEEFQKAKDLDPNFRKLGELYNLKVLL